ncbi:MAG: hypothetical protein ABI378_01450 [Chitinophagaceae bacterium]
MFRNSARSSAFGLFTAMLFCTYGIVIAATFFYKSILFGTLSLMVAIVIFYVRSHEIKRKIVLAERAMMEEKAKVNQALLASEIARQFSEEKTGAKEVAKARILVEIQSPYNVSNILLGFPPICLN